MIEELTDPLDLVEIVSFLAPEEPIASWPEAKKDPLKTFDELMNVTQNGKIFI
jgi:hypothetical protein